MQSGADRARSRSILIGAAMMMTVAMGMRQSLGLFIGPVTHDLALTTADFTFAVAIQNISWGASQALVGAFADRRGSRPVMMAGAVVYAVGLAVMLMAHGLVGARDLRRADRHCAVLHRVQPGDERHRPGRAGEPAECDARPGLRRAARSAPW